MAYRHLPPRGAGGVGEGDPGPFFFEEKFVRNMLSVLLFLPPESGHVLAP